MEKLKKIFMFASLVFIALCFGASVWLYTVQPDAMSIAFMVVFFLALVWFGFNVRNQLKS